MGLPSMHGSQNMNHIRLTNKLFYVQAKFNYMQKLLSHKASPTQVFRQRPKNLFRKAANVHKASQPWKLSLPSLTNTQKQRLKHMKKAFPVVSNMPFIHINSSLILVNTSPFALTDPRFGILHHHSPSISYF